MSDYKKKFKWNFLEKKKREQEKIDKWAKNDWEKIIQKVREKSKSNLKPEDLPW